VRASLCSFALTGLLAAGCGGGGVPQAFEGDCVARVTWRGVDYASAGSRFKAPVAFGPRIGDAAIRACPDDPVLPVSALSIRGVSLEVAIGLEGKEWPRSLWLAAGYIGESPRHPLHRAIYGSDHEPDETAGFRCEAPRALRARVAGAPQYQRDPLHVVARHARDTPFLTDGNADGLVTLDAHTRIAGLTRHGVPYVEAGDRVRLVIRACRAIRELPDAIGDRLLIADRLGRA
jgi:hypothetical protein